MKHFVTIEQAAQELTNQSFVIWMGLQNLTPNELHSGLIKIASKLKVTWRKFRRCVAELESKSYLRFKMHFVGEMKKIALLKGLDFENFGILKKGEQKGTGYSDQNPTVDKNEHPLFAPIKQVSFPQKMLAHKIAKAPDAKGVKALKKSNKNKTKATRKNFQNSSKIGRDSSRSDSRPLLREEIHSISELNKIPNSDLKIESSKIRDKRASENNNQTSTNTKQTRQFSLRSKLKSGTQESQGFHKYGIMWERLWDIKTSFDFTPDEDTQIEREETLQLDKRSKERRKLLEHAGETVGKLYQAYRRADQESNGKRRSFTLISTEYKYCRTVSEICIMREIHPLDLMEYWDEHIEQFTPGNLSYPTLSFLASPANVDSAVSALERKRQDKEKEANGIKPNKNRFDSFDGINDSHRQMKVKLYNAGFDVESLTDENLKWIQEIGKKMIKKPHVSIDNTSKLYALARWVADNIYAEGKN